MGDPGDSLRITDDFLVSDTEGYAAGSPWQLLELHYIPGGGNINDAVNEGYIDGVRFLALNGGNCPMEFRVVVWDEYSSVKAFCGADDESGFNALWRATTEDGQAVVNYFAQGQQLQNEEMNGGRKRRSKSKRSKRKSVKRSTRKSRRKFSQK
jgi:hypothetical protein